MASMFDTASIVQDDYAAVVVDGTSEDDTLNSGTNNSVLNGFAGNDTLTTGYLGASYTGELYARQYGGAGRDNLSVLINASTFYSYTELRGGTGADTLAVNNTITNEDGGNVALNENYLVGGRGDDVLNVDAVLGSVSGGNIMSEAYGGRGNDSITMTARVLEGTDVDLASNYASGGAGNDRIYLTGFGDADDYLINEAIGGAGDDLIVGRTEGGYGESYLAGGAGNDALQVIGGDYNELYGQAGDDKLFGGTGTDIMSGGEGADIFFFYANGGQDVITDFEIGIDRIDLGEGDLAVTIGSLSNVGSDTLVTFADGASVLLQGVTITDQAQLFA